MALGTCGIVQNTTPFSKSLSEYVEFEQLREMGIKKERTEASGQRKRHRKPEACPQQLIIHVNVNVVKHKIGDFTFSANHRWNKMATTGAE